MSNDEFTMLARRVRLLERKIDKILEHLEIDFEDNDVGIATNVSPDVIDWVRRGNIIEAIKVYRSYSGVGLKEAKDVIDEINVRVKQGML